MPFSSAHTQLSFFYAWYILSLDLTRLYSIMNTNLRDKFPSLSRKHSGKNLIFLDGPAGTQVPLKVIDGISDYYKNSNANRHGRFITTQETDEIIQTTRNNVAAFLGAQGGHQISIGQNMTSLNYSLSRAIGRTLFEGDEILITQLDHESNRGPWLALQEFGIVVREVNLLPNGTLDYKDFVSKINERTKLVAMGWASNITGTINDVKRIRKLTYQVGAMLLIDAVHYAAHFSLDVQSIGCDFLLCSAYKFYGPHVGLLYSKAGVLDRLPTDNLRTAEQYAPYKIETGTLNHAAIAGVSAAIDFLAEQGSGRNQAAKLNSAMTKIAKHEFKLGRKLYSGIKKIKGVKILGPDFSSPDRAPTISFYSPKLTATQICEALARKNICAWAGHFYAMRATEILGYLDKGGVTRMGISMYTSASEIDKTLKVLSTILK